MGMKRNYGPLYAAPQTGWLLLFFAAPLAIIVAYSFMEKGLYGGVNPRLSMEAYRSLANPSLLAVALRTLWVSLAATVFTLIIALPCGYSIARSKNQPMIRMAMATRKKIDQALASNSVVSSARTRNASHFSLYL